MADDKLALLVTETRDAFASETRRHEIAQVLPKGYSPESYLRTVLTLHLRNPKLFYTTMQSRWLSIMQAAELALPIDGTMAALTPYKNRAQLIVMTQGYTQLFYRHPRVAAVGRPQLVYEGEEYEYTEGLRPKIVHKPKGGERQNLDKLVAAYATVQVRGGGTAFAWLWREELDRRRDVSAAYKAGYGPWFEWPEQMYRKTPLRELAKYVPKSTELSMALAYDEPSPEDERPLPPLDGDDKTVIELLDTIAGEESNEQAGR